MSKTRATMNTIGQVVAFGNHIIAVCALVGVLYGIFTFWDDLQHIMYEVVTPENEAEFNALWLDYEKRMGVE